MNVAHCQALAYGVLVADVCSDPGFIPTFLQAVQDQGTHLIQAEDSVSGDIQNGSSVLAGGCAYSLCQLVNGKFFFMGFRCHGAHYLIP
jgi:hypothetical protein